MQYQVFRRIPGQAREILGNFPGNTPGQAIAAATVDLQLGPNEPHIQSWCILTRHLRILKVYISIKPKKQGHNEGAISHDADLWYVDCRQFFGQQGESQLYERMLYGGTPADGMLAMQLNTKGGHVMGAGAGQGYVGYQQFPNQEQAIDFLRYLAFEPQWI